MARSVLRRFDVRFDAQTTSWATVTAGTLGRLALGFVASVVIARSLGPSDFGVYALLGAVAGVAGVLGDPGLTPAGVKRVASAWPDQPELARERAGGFVWLRLLAMLPVVALGAGLSSLLARLILGRPELAGLLALTFLGVAATAASGAATALLQATGRFDRLSAVILLNSGLTAVLAAGLATTGHLTLVSAILVLGVGTSLGSLVLGWRFLPWSGVLPITGAHRSEAAWLFRFGRWLWLGDVLAALGAQLDVFLLNHWAGLATVGAYALALNLASKADVVNHSLYTVLLPAASTVRGSADVQAYVRRSLRRSAGIVALLVLLFLVAGPLITTFYGEGYRGAVELFQLLLIVVAFDVVATPLTLLAYGAERPGLIAGSEATRLAVFLALGVGLVPAFGPVGAILARGASHVVAAALVLVALRSGVRNSA